MKNINSLRADIIKWDKQKQASMTEDMRNIEEQLLILDNTFGDDYFSISKKERIINLEQQKATILA